MPVALRVQVGLIFRLSQSVALRKFCYGRRV